MKKGQAELFGTELVKGKQYEFHTGAKVAIFTYHGCSLTVKGEMDVHYIAKETPMVQYLNSHAALEQLRIASDENNENGPVAMIVGPCDVGKSTVCRIFLNYAVRQGRTPICVDLDVGQGSISIPGTTGAFLVERIAHVEDGFSQQAPLVYQFGHLSPAGNDAYYNLLLSKLADVTLKRMQTNKKIKSSGMIINTCGWIKGEGYKHILHAAEAFQVAAIFVLDQERLYNELLRDVPKTAQGKSKCYFSFLYGFDLNLKIENQLFSVVFLQKSGGVVERSKALRIEARDTRIREYFYGKRSPLYPHSFDVKWSDIQICKVGAPALPDSCMPLGMKAEGNKTKLLTIQPSQSILHHILAVTFCETISDEVIHSNIAGFVCV